MATQALIADTIAGMKKAVKRKAYDSDSDNSIEQLTNRGNKLRKKARYVHEGQLAPPTGPQVYRRRIEHAGFQREIISRNPPLLDEDGYEIESEDDDERSQAAVAAAAELDPYSNVKIENLLAPLTAASDLPHHPTLSKPFLSKTLTELTRQAGEMLQKEKASLWRIKHLLTRLSGDLTWIPCEIVETDNDIALFGDDRDRQRGNQVERAHIKDDGDHISSGILVSDEAAHQARSLISETEKPDQSFPEASTDQAEKTDRADATMTSVSQPLSDGLGLSEKELHKSQDADENVQGSETVPDADLKASTDISMMVDVKEAIKPSEREVIEEPTEKQVLGEGTEIIDADEGPGEEDVPAPHRMRTRAQAQAMSDNTANSQTRSLTPESSMDPLIHPYFLAPRTSHPDRDLGLPRHEAEETRRLLQLYIQKQEEVCRGAQRVYEGLLRADRCRHLVLKWAKAEAHIGANRDMSDGEDWYDKEEWGLEEDLKKGQDEDEETGEISAKKTRTRRQ